MKKTLTVELNNEDNSIKIDAEDMSAEEAVNSTIHLIIAISGNLDMLPHELSEKIHGHIFGVHEMDKLKKEQEKKDVQ